MNYLIPDNKDLHKAVRAKLVRDNWSNDVYRVSKYALGESFKRVLIFGYNGGITWDSVTKKMEDIRRLIAEEKIGIFDLEDIGDGWKEHLSKLMAIEDSFVQNADRLILAFFCADQEAKRFYTLDSHIIRSDKINSYVKKLDKRIVEV
ncbi:MAG: hypothetical protein ACP5NK_00860 [Thermoplasmata archaeon]